MIAKAIDLIRDRATRIIEMNVNYSSPFLGLGWKAPTKEKYVTIRGESNNLKDAAVLFLIRLRAYVLEKTESNYGSHTVYWRMFPYISREVETKNWVVRARLLVTDAPVNVAYVTGVRD